MAGHNPEEFGVTPRKVRSVGTTTIVAMLIADRLRAIDQEKAPDFEAKFKDRIAGKAAQGLLRRYQTVHEEAKRIEARVTSMGLTIHTYKGYSLGVAYTVTNSAREQYKADKTRRIDQVKALRLRSHMDLLGMDAKAARTYLLKLKKTLAGI